MTKTPIDPHAEKRIAQIAEQKLTAAMSQRIGSLGFKQHAQGDQGIISKTKGRGDYKLGAAPGGKVKYYMNGLALVMPRHGFIQHYGATGTREDIKGRTRYKPKTTTYHFANHRFNLPAKSFIDDAIAQSGVVDFVMLNISKIRTQDVFVKLKNFIEKP